MLRFNQEISKGTFRTIKKTLEEAEEMDADYYVMELNTYGGLVVAADSIRTALLNAEIPVISFVNNNAASAGALISIACDSIYMTEGANIGAATVVDGTGAQLPDKYQSYMRSTMRSTAEANNRDPLIAEGMVDDRVEIPGVIEAGKVITFTTSEAIENDFCEGEMDSVKEVIEDGLGLDDYKVTKYEPSFTDKLISILLSPQINSFLLVMIFGGIYFELKTPGVGFPLAAALIGAILFFAPAYVEGLADNWEIALFIIGLILVALEIFVFPGFGVAGLAGAIAILTSLTFALIDNSDFKVRGVDMGEVNGPLLRVSLTLALATGLFFWLSSKIIKKRNDKKSAFVLDGKLDAESGFTVKESHIDALIGQTGEVMNELKPSGKIIIDGEIYAAVSESSWVERGKQVKVMKVDVNNLVVRETNVL